MEITLKLNIQNAKHEIAELKEFIEKNNPKGIKLTLESRLHQEGELGCEWMNLLNIGLATSGGAVALKGFFDLLKAYFIDLKKHKISTSSEFIKHNNTLKAEIINKMIDKSFATIIIKDKSGIEKIIPVNTFDVKEIEYILEQFSTDNH